MRRFAFAFALGIAACGGLLGGDEDGDSSSSTSSSSGGGADGSASDEASGAVGSSDAGDAGRFCQPGAHAFCADFDEPNATLPGVFEPPILDGTGASLDLAPSFASPPKALRIAIKAGSGNANASTALLPKTFDVGASGTIDVAMDLEHTATMFPDDSNGQTFFILKCGGANVYISERANAGPTGSGNAWEIVVQDSSGARTKMDPAPPLIATPVHVGVRLVPKTVTATLSYDGTVVATVTGTFAFPSQTTQCQLSVGAETFAASTDETLLLDNVTVDLSP